MSFTTQEIMRARIDDLGREATRISQTSRASGGPTGLRGHFAGTLARLAVCIDRDAAAEWIAGASGLGRHSAPPQGSHRG